MLIYFTIFFLFVLAAFIESFGAVKPAMLLLVSTCAVLLFLTAIREGIGTDFYNYKGIYDSIVLNEEVSIEFGFYVLNVVAYLFGGFKILLFLSSLINLLAIVYVLKKFDLNISMGVLTYFSLFFLNHNFNVMRHGIMSTIVWVALYFFYERKKILNLATYFFSCLFHNLGLAFIVLQFFTKWRVSIKYSILLLTVLFFIGEQLKDFFLFANIFVAQFNNKLEYYLTEYNNGDEIVRYKFAFGFFLYVIIYLLILKFENYFENKTQVIYFSKLLFIGIAMTVLFASVSIFSERISNTLLMSLIFIFASINKIKVNSTVKFLFVIVFVAIDFFYLLKILNLPGPSREFQYLPYSYTFF